MGILSGKNGLIMGVANENQLHGALHRQLPIMAPNWPLPIRLRGSANALSRLPPRLAHLILSNVMWPLMKASPRHLRRLQISGTGWTLLCMLSAFQTNQS